jgi:hypothetical protein
MSRSDVTLLPEFEDEREDVRRALLVLASKHWKFESIVEGIVSTKRVAIVYSWAENDHGRFSIQFSPATYLLLGVNADECAPDGRTLLKDSMKLLLNRLGVERGTPPLARMTIN